MALVGSGFIELTAPLLYSRGSEEENRGQSARGGRGILGLWGIEAATLDSPDRPPIFRIPE